MAKTNALRKGILLAVLALAFTALPALTLRVYASVYNVSTTEDHDGWARCDGLSHRRTREPEA